MTVPSRFFRCLFLGGLALAAVGLVPRPAHAVIVERVVAVIGDKSVLLSELRRRARPRLMMNLMQQQQQDQASAAAGETKAFKETLDEMVNERLIEQAADKSKVFVSTQEIDRALRQKADSIRMTLAQLLVEAQREGFTEQDYRDEIRRQLLEGKMIQLRVQGRVRISEQDARASYTHFVHELGDESPVDLQVLAMQLPSSVPAIEAKRALAQEIVANAKKDAESFCTSVKKYSDDVQTKDSCGSRGLQPVKALFPVVREQLGSMKEGEVSNPIQIGDRAIVVFRLAHREPIPAYDQVKDQMMERATGEAVDRQRKLWLDELKRGVFVEIRL